MPFLNIEDARAGMVLVSDVTDRRGRLLIPSGRELDEKHLQALRMWGISTVEIEGDEPSGEEEGALDPAYLGQARELLTDRLQNLPMDHALVLALVEVALPTLARDLSREAPQAGEAHVQ